MCPKKLHALADCANRASCCVAIRGCQEIMQPFDVVQRSGRPDHPCHWSTIRLWWFHVLTGFETRQPRVGLGCRDVQAGRLVLDPGGERILLELRAAFFAVEVFLDG